MRLFQYFFDKLIKHYNIDREKLNIQLYDWIKKIGETDKSKSDFIWSTMQSISIEIAKKYSNENELYINLRKIYCDMFEFLINEKRNVAHITKMISYCDLMTSRNKDFEIDAYIIGMKDCNEAKKHDGERLSIEDAITISTYTIQKL